MTSPDFDDPAVFAGLPLASPTFVALESDTFDSGRALFIEQDLDFRRVDRIRDPADPGDRGPTSPPLAVGEPAKKRRGTVSRFALSSHLIAL
jgi:hypothetical protein